jgi:hypothetical protein
MTATDDPQVFLLKNTEPGCCIRSVYPYWEPCCPSGISFLGTRRREARNDLEEIRKLGGVETRDRQKEYRIRDLKPLENISWHQARFGKVAPALQPHLTRPIQALRWQTTPRPPRNTYRLSIFCEIKLQSSHFTNVQSIMASQDRAWTPQEALYPADELEELLGQKRCAELKQECTEEILLLHLFNEFEWETSPRKKRIAIVDLSILHRR